MIERWLAGLGLGFVAWRQRRKAERAASSVIPWGPGERASSAGANGGSAGPVDGTSVERASRPAGPRPPWMG